MAKTEIFCPICKEIYYLNVIINDTFIIKCENCLYSSEIRIIKYDLTPYPNCTA